jgi:hypothetical protein
MSAIVDDIARFLFGVFWCGSVSVIVCAHVFGWVE